MSIPSSSWIKGQTTLRLRSLAWPYFVLLNGNIFLLLIFWTCSQYHISQNSQQVLHRTLHSLRVKKMSYKVQERSYLLINVCVVWNQKMALQFTVASVFLVFIPFLTASIFPKYWFSQVEWCDVSGNRNQEFSELKGTGNASWSKFPEITVTEYII